MAVSHFLIEFGCRGFCQRNALEQRERIRKIFLLEIEFGNELQAVCVRQNVAYERNFNEVERCFERVVEFRFAGKQVEKPVEVLYVFIGNVIAVFFRVGQF